LLHTHLLQPLLGVHGLLPQHLVLQQSFPQLVIHGHEALQACMREASCLITPLRCLRVRALLHWRPHRHACMSPPQLQEEGRRAWVRLSAARMQLHASVRALLARPPSQPPHLSRVRISGSGLFGIRLSCRCSAVQAGHAQSGRWQLTAEGRPCRCRRCC